MTSQPPLSLGDSKTFSHFQCITAFDPLYPIVMSNIKGNPTGSANEKSWLVQAKCTLSWIEFLLSLVIRSCLNIVTFGFPPKYRERLKFFEALVPDSDERWSTPPEFSDRGSKDKSSQKSMREKQQVVNFYLFHNVLLLNQAFCLPHSGGVGSTKYRGMHLPVLLQTILHVGLT